MREEDRQWRGHTRSMSISPSYLSPGSERHETQLQHIRHFRQYLLLPLNQHQGAMNAKSRHLFPGSAQRPCRMNVEPSKGRGTKGGEDHVGFVRDELVLGCKRDFLRCVGRSSGRNGGRSMGSQCPLRRTGWLNPA